MHHQFNIQQLYVLPTLYLYVLCASQNKQPIFCLDQYSSFSYQIIRYVVIL